MFSNKIESKINIPRLSSLLESFYKISEMAIAVLDNQKELVLIFGGQKICFDYHRQDPRLSQGCRECESYVYENLRAGEHIEYKCSNGLWDIAFPITIQNKIVGTIWIGQFFFDDDPINLKFFKKQAVDSGFPINEYLTAIKEVPIYTREKVQNVINFLDNLCAICASEEEKVLIELQLLQAQKMETIGTLAGQIAHDFNNILSAILNNTELAMEDVPEWSPAGSSLKEVKIACHRAKDIIQQILSFTKKVNPKPKPIEISPIIKDSIKFLRSAVPASIDIHITVPDESITVLADSNQIYQVMLNLFTNAIQAMPKNGGIIEVNLSVIEIGKVNKNQTIEVNEGKYVKITVSDTGHGITKEHFYRIFEPYFTTKEVNGGGSGIGLSIVHGIVKGHKGAISVDSKYGKGTTFNIFLPLAVK